MNATHPWFIHWNKRNAVEEARRKAQHRSKRSYKAKPITVQTKGILEAKGYTA